MIFQSIILFLLFITLAVSIYAARKAYWAAVIAKDTLENLYSWSRNITRQIECLDGLYQRLELPRGSLPPTRGWAASPDFLVSLYDHIREHQPIRMIECGSGLTTIVTARCLQQAGTGGKLVSLEHDPYFAGKTEKILQRLGLDSFVDIFVAPLKPVTIGSTEYLWYDIENAPLPDKIDLVVIDGPPKPLAGEECRYPAGPLLFDRLSAKAAVLLDDAARPGEKRIVTKFLAEFPHLSREDLPAEKGCVMLTRQDF